MASGTITEERTSTVSLERHNGEGDVIDTVELDATIFGVVPNVPLMHQVVTAQLAARRSGTHSTKTRAEVAGGGAKPYRQKGTGRARQGSIRAPHFSGGGVALGPKPRSYAQRTPRKMIRLALCSALSDRLNEGKVRLVDAWPFEVPKTKDAMKALRALELEGRILVVLSSDDAVAERSFGNLPYVHLVEAAQLSAYEVLANDWIVFTTATVPGGVRVVEGSAPKAKTARKKPAAAGAPAASGGDTSVGDDSSAEEDVTPVADESLDQAEGSEAVEEPADEADADDDDKDEVEE
ncbi:MAG TPA: 50S ribosomal protein L4 [Acidimicrobiales bacterium]|nr:50S ribosomal protein L4 [Acidimicrobiales bacterium]